MGDPNTKLSEEGIGEACSDCDVVNGKVYCTMNCGPAIPINDDPLGIKSALRITRGHLKLSKPRVTPEKPIADEGKPTQQDNAQNLRYATQIASSLHRNFYPEVTQWKPLAGDLFGVLMQIDNMITGLQRKTNEEKQVKETTTVTVLGEQRGNICHSLSPKKERCTKEDGHEGHWHIGMRSRWTTKEQHPDSPTGEQRGVDKFFGTWPGNETDSELLGALDEIRKPKVEQRGDTRCDTCKLADALLLEGKIG